MNRKAQEEMIGFALIVILVAVVILVFISFSVRDNQGEVVESFEARSFVDATLQYTTECRDYLEYLSLRDLIFKCNQGTNCLDGEDSCELLESTMEGILESSWSVKEGSFVRGYEFEILSDTQDILSIMEGNETSELRGSYQDFSRGGSSIQILFTAYY